MKNPCYRDLKETHSTNPVMFLLPCRLPLCNFWTSRFCVASALQLAIKNYDANLYMYRDVLGSFFSSIGFLYHFIWFFSSSFFYPCTLFLVTPHVRFFLDPCLMCFQISSSIRFSHSSNHINFFLLFFFIFFCVSCLAIIREVENRTLKKGRKTPRSISRECSVRGIY